MIAWSPEYPRYKRPFGYLRLIKARIEFYEHFRFTRISGLKFRMLRLPGYCERLAALHNIHAGRRAFVLGTGPSLAIADVRRLKNEITFGCNGLYKMYEQLGWAATYHTVIDRTQLEDRADDLNRMTGTTFFAPLFGAYCIKPRIDTIFLPFRWPDTRHFDYPQFSEDASSAVWDGMTVTITNLQLAFHMGIREVILLGIDFSYSLNQQITSSDVVSSVTSSPDHFIKDYYTGQKRFVQFYPELQQQAYAKSRQVFASHGGRLLNASRSTMLDVVERVDFDSLFATGMNP